MTWTIHGHLARTLPHSTSCPAHTPPHPSLRHPPSPHILLLGHFKGVCGSCLNYFVIFWKHLLSRVSIVEEWVGLEREDDGVTGCGVKGYEG